jgi:hypothetical protein
MSFLKKLFGGGTGSGGAQTKTVKSIEHKGFLIEATPYSDGGQYQLAGVISKTFDGVKKEHKFVRADKFQSLEDAADIALSKGQLIVDQSGDRIFD